ncbi:hypothetical protein DNU06_07215 [Putridiphycobacter roseus]|uniref:DUF4836 domain-containing protein n=1 Tax=Putridiphycobacter roseus TaxID=2219161 RepID=A0A2W1N3J8_9FLAO|nr:hypothetical protein [Putridiphycobacter roseus]PZE17611.1 hypothetical protein DNU06_07215 [Putridiphycobacter roseus]
MFRSKNKWSKLGVVIFLVGSVFFVSCKKELAHKDKVAAIIGKLESPFLMGTFVPENIIEKAGLEDGALPFVQQTIASFFMQEEKTGINNKAQVQLVIAKGEGSFPQAYAFVALKNAAKFKKLVETELSAEVQEKDGVFYFRKEADNYLVVWDAQMAIISNIPITLDNILSSSGISSKKAAIKIVGLMGEVGKGDIEPNYRAFMDKPGDVRMYLHGQNAYDMVKEIRFFPIKYKKQMALFLLGSTFETVLNFENGRIQLENDHLLSDSLTAYMEMFKEEGIDPEMLTFGYSANPAMALALNMDSDKFAKMMDITQWESYSHEVAKSLNDKGISKEDIAAFSTGKTLFILDEVEKVKQEDNINDLQDLNARYGMVVEIKDTVVARLVMQKVLTDSLLSSREEMFATIQNKYLILSNSRAWIEKIEANNAVSIAALKTQLTINPIGFYMNNNLLGDMSTDEDFNKTVKVVQDVVFEFNKSKSSLSIKMKDADKNSLRVIVEKLIEEMMLTELNSNSDIQTIIEQEMLEDISEEAIETVINALLK